LYHVWGLDSTLLTQTVILFFPSRLAVTGGSDKASRIAQWQAKLAVSDSPAPELPKARWEAFIKAMRKAPVRLGPMPIEAARAGIKIKDAKANPVPNASEPELLGWGRTAICWFVIVCLG